jgi:hypothetical protein
LLELEQRIEDVSMPDEVKQVVTRELKRLKRLQPVHPEYNVIRSYLECMVELPWSTTTPEMLDIPQARAKLDGKSAVDRRVSVDSTRNSRRLPNTCYWPPSQRITSGSSESRNA